MILFGVCFFFVVYFWIKYRRERQLLRHLTTFDHRTQALEKDLFLQKITSASGKQCVVLFIEYLEKFVTSDATGVRPLQAYANLSELLVPQGFTEKEVEALEHVLYADTTLSKDLKIKIDQYCVAKID